MTQYAEAEALPESGLPSVPGTGKQLDMNGWREHPRENGDELWQIVQRVFLAGKCGNAPRAVAFCGVDHGAGTTSVCLKTAELLARGASGKVCLIDANLRTPSLHARFKVRRAPGFVELLNNSRPLNVVAQRISGSNLWVVPAGASIGEMNGTLNMRNLSAHFAELRAEFDFLLIDTPAVGVYSDAMVLGQLTDGIVLVVASNLTRREAALSAKLSFETAQIPVLGAVLNRRTFPIPDVIYRRI